MKKAMIATVLAFAASTASAQSDFALTFAVPDGLTAGTSTYNEIRLDADIGSRFISTHGVLSDGEFWAPATGSCFATGVGGVLCNVQADQYSITMDMDGNLSGTATMKNANGMVVDTSSVHATMIQ